jgi:hypothetical protein
MISHPFPQSCYMPVHLVPLTSVLMSHFHPHSCYIPDQLIPFNFTTDLESPSPVVLHARSSRPPYFSTDVSFPSPFVLHTRPSHPPYVSTNLASLSPLACWHTDRTIFPRRCNRKLLIEVMREISRPVVLKFGWPRKDAELICSLCLQCGNLFDLLGVGVELRRGSSKMNFALVRCS